MNEPEGYISLSEAAKLTGYSAGHIRRLCVSGKLQAQKIGKTWLVTPNELNKLTESLSTQAPTLPEIVGTSVFSYSKIQKLTGLAVSLMVFIPVVSNLTNFPDRMATLVDKTNQVVVTTQATINDKIKNYIQTQIGGSGQVAGTTTTVVYQTESSTQPVKPQVLGISISDAEVLAAVKAIMFNETLSAELVAKFKGQDGKDGVDGKNGIDGIAGTTVQYIPNSGSVFGTTAPTAQQGHQGTIGSATYLSSRDFQTETLTVATRATINGDLNLTGNSNFSGDLIVNNGRIGVGTTSPQVSIHVVGTDAIVIPVGTTAQRPANIQGAIRYNTTTSTFEGYSGTIWSGLGGVIDLDQDTYILSESSPGADEDTLFFFTNGTEKVRITPTGGLGLGGTDPIIDLTTASTLNINTTTNRPVTFGTGLVTIPYLSVTNAQSNNGTMIIDSAATTATIFQVTGASLTSGTAIGKTVTANAGNGQVTKGETITLTDSTVAGGGFTGIGITVTGAGVGSGNKYLLSLNPNTANNEVVFDNLGAFRPTTDVASNTATVGSPAFYWKNGYFDQITANNIAGTVVGGATSSTTWTIGSTEAGDVNEALIFQRNSGSGNASLQWNAGAGDLRYLSTNYPFNSTYTVTDGSIGTGINLYSGNLTNNTTGGTQKLLSLVNTGTGTTETGIYLSNTGTGTTALEIAGTWTTGILTNNNSINTGTGTITSGLINGQTISSAANFTGTMNVEGKLTLEGSSSDGSTSGIEFYSDPFVLGNIFHDVGNGDLDKRGLVIKDNASYGINFWANHNSAEYRFWNGDQTAQVMTIEGSGNVGIGDSTPDYLLDVAGTLGVDGAVTFASTINSQTISSTANFTGTAAFATSISINGGTALTTTNQTGTGSIVMSNTPTLVTPNIGAATGTSLNLGAGAITSGLINGQTISSTTNFTGTVAVATSVSTPSLISTGAIGITPNAGSNLNISLSTTGDLVVNTNQLYVDTSTGFVGIGTATPNNTIQVANLINFDNTDFNTRLGYTAGNNIAVGAQYNTYIGYESGLAASFGSTTGADNNVAVGYRSMYQNTSGSENTAMGFMAMRENRGGTANTAIGYLALIDNQNGSQNTAIGYHALLQSQSGDNTAVGSFTLRFSSGAANTAVGVSALGTNGSGTQNVAMGSTALNSSSGGSYNTVLGSAASYHNTSADGVVAIGYAAALGSSGAYVNEGGVYVGASSGYMAQTGSDFNTFVGYNSGYSTTTGAYNIAIGQQVELPSATGSQQLNIGNVLYGTGIYGGGVLSSAPVAGGRIGIGTATPSTTLDVNGGIASTALTVSSGTLTASDPISFNQTWNNGAVTFNGLRVSATDTASASASNILELRGGSAGTDPIFRVSKTGNIHLSNGPAGAAGGGGVIYFYWNDPNSSVGSISSDNIGNFRFVGNSVMADRFILFNGGSQNAGIRLNGADTTCIFASGNCHLNVQGSTGNVGIGTATPVDKLDVRDGIFSLTDSDVAHGITGDLGNTEAYGRLRPVSTTAGGLFVQGASDSTSISGLALIGYGQSGLTAPAVMIAGLKRSGTSAVATTGTDPVLRVSNDGAASIIEVLANGKVGIGTTSPYSAISSLHVEGAKDTVNKGMLGVFDSTAMGAGVGGRIILGGTYISADSSKVLFAGIEGYKENATSSNYAGALLLSTTPNGGNLTERMRIDSTGNVGIGTTTPGAKLDVRGGNIEMTASGVTHGLTAVGATNSFASFRPTDSNLGGLQVYGITDADGTAINMSAIIGASDPVDATPAFVLQAGKSNGTTSWQALGALETAFQFKNFSTNLVTILGSGNVGIGTTSAQSLLTLAGAGSPLAFINTSSSNKVWRLEGNGNNFTVVEQGVGTPMTFEAGGNIGIGTTDPGRLLHVYGSASSLARFESTATGGPSVSWSQNGTQQFVIGAYSAVTGVGTDYTPTIFAETGLGINFTVNGSVTRAMMINSSGNVGIGTTNPTFPLSVQANSGANAISIIGRNNASVDEGTLTFLDNDNATTQAYLQTAGTRLGIYAQGGVHLGTAGTDGSASMYTKFAGYNPTNPGSGDSFGALVLNANTYSTGGERRWMVTNALDYTKFAIIRSVDGTTDPVINSSAALTSGTADFVIQNDGNVGIGATSPTARLHISSAAGQGIKISATSQTDRYIGIDGSNQLNIGDWADGTKRIVMNNSGNVGIGTTNPSAGKLHVENTSAGSITSVLALQNNSSTAGTGVAIEFAAYTSFTTARIAALNESGTATNSLVFYTHDGGTLAEKMRINSAGVVSIQNLGLGYVCSNGGGQLSYGASCATSDERLKTNVVNISSEMDVLDSLHKLNGVYYDWDFSNSFNSTQSHTRQLGMIAQNVEQVFPELVYYSQADGYARLDYQKLTGFLVEVSKQLDLNIQELDNKTAGNYSSNNTSVGDVVAVSGNSSVIKATSENNAIGVVSSNTGTTRVQYIGRMSVKVSEENGAVNAGDRLQVSNLLPGYAAKMTASGTSIGTALESSAGGVEGTDMIEAMISIGYQKINVAQNQQNGQLFTVDSTYDFNNNSLINVKTIASMNGTWSISEDGKLVIQEIQTQKLCIGLTCVDEPTLVQLLQDAGLSGQSNQGSGGGDGGVVSGEEEGGEEPPVEEVTPEEEPVPEEEPAPEPEPEVTPEE